MAKRMTSVLLALFLVFSLFNVSVYAESTFVVGEPVTFTAEGGHNYGGGSGTVDTRTDEQKAADAQNYSLLHRYDGNATELMSLYDLYTADWAIHSPGNYLFTSTADIPADQLGNIGRDTYGNAFVFNPGGTGYCYYTPKGQYRQSNPSLTGIPNAASELREYVEGHNYMTASTQPAINIVSHAQPDISLRQQMLDLGAYNYVSLGGYPVLDFSTYQDRLNGLAQFISIYGEDIVTTRYILEVKAESVSINQTRTRQIQEFFPGMYFWWRCENIIPDSSDPSAIQPIVGYGSNNFVVRFPYSGRYHVSAAQKILYTYCDAMTVSVNEYWVVEATGQIIYSRESTGGKINPNIPLSSQTLNNLRYPYYNYDDETYLEEVFSDYCRIINTFMGDGTTPGFRDIGFQTERIR